MPDHFGDISADISADTSPDDSVEALAPVDLAFAGDAPPPDQGDSVFPALAEVHRREGRPDEAEQVARRGLEFEPQRSDGRLVLALSLLDQGAPEQIEEAKGLLARLADRVLEVQGIDTSSRGDVVEPLPPERREAPELAVSGSDRAEHDLSEHEIDRAFEDAETDPEQLIDADQIAQQAMRQVDGGLDEDLLSAPEAPFATRTMADLLEGQGDAERASRIRAVLDPVSDHPDGESSSNRRRRIIMELEGWIENLRRSRA